MIEYNIYCDESCHLENKHVNEHEKYKKAEAAKKT